jgi:hypothetical protein
MHCLYGHFGKFSSQLGTLNLGRLSQFETHPNHPISYLNTQVVIVR